jgi:hypothetical protein
MKPLAFLRLTRILSHTKYGTFGVLKHNENWLCVTLEPPDGANRANVSCIPPGQYLCGKHLSNKFGKTWTVMNVPDRKFILFHPGNKSPDTQGCIILAEHFGKLKGELAVLNSGKTFSLFLDIMEEYEMAHLTISTGF